MLFIAGDQLWTAFASKYGLCAKFVYADWQEPSYRTGLQYVVSPTEESSGRNKQPVIIWGDVIRRDRFYGLESLWRGGMESAQAWVVKASYMAQTSYIRSFHGDGAYDKFGFREVLGDGIAQIIPHPKNAVTQKGKGKKPLPDYLIQRNRAIEYINKHGSKSRKEENGYQRRSINEVVMFRYKTIFGWELDARTLENQKSEVKLKCLTLNKFIGIGIPDVYKVS